jgi:hypothetical protein
MFKGTSILVGFLLIGSQSAFAYDYVSVAAVTLTNSDGSARGVYGKAISSDAAQAEELAMQNCGSSGCKVLATNTGCIALTYDNSKRVMAGTADNIEAAQSNVSALCQSSSAAGGCVLWVTFCADGYDSNQ